MKKELWFVAAGALIILVLLVVVLQGEPVAITKSKPVVTTKHFSPDDPPKELAKGRDGITKWQFFCPAEVNYQLVEEVADSTGSFVRVKILGMNVNLGLNITMWVPKDADKKLTRHEQDHASICQRIYKDADTQAQLCASQIIGKVYSATGATTEASCKLAGNKGVREFMALYEETVARKAQDVSEIYDLLSKHKVVSRDKLLEHAFTVYERGKPRTLSARPRARQLTSIPETVDRIHK